MEEDASSGSSSSDDVVAEAPNVPAVPRTHYQTPVTTHFQLMVTGRIESAQMFGQHVIYCKYSLVYGPDWEFVTGMDEGVSQLSEKGAENQFVWNFPLEMGFKSCNPFGWPQIVVAVYGSDFFGNHVVRGYASTHLPLSEGSFTKIIPLFVPESSSFLQKLSSWILGRRPEFVDSKIVAQNDGRQLVRVNSGGFVLCKFDSVLKNFSKLGYSTSPAIFKAKKNEVTTDIVISVVESLKRQVELERLKSSETLGALKSFVLENEGQDPFLHAPDPKDNPWHSKGRKCEIS